MYELDAVYLEQLENIAAHIQASPELQQYLEEEEESFYTQLKDTYEPHIAQVHQTVAAEQPLQLIHLEQILLNEAFEGLFLPKILGYSVLRGAIDTNYKYIHPQDHFRDILNAICESTNFDLLKKRIGQSIQIGFALSSDIWVTNFINNIDNKRVRQYLTGLKADRYRVLENRKVVYHRYAQQFVSDNFLSIVFPDNPSALTLDYSALERFFLYRALNQENNSTILAATDAFLSDTQFIGTKEHLRLCLLYGAYFPLPEDSHTLLVKNTQAALAKTPHADEVALEFLLTLQENPETALRPEHDVQLAGVVDPNLGKTGEYLHLLKTIHTDGYTNPGTQEAIRTVYLNHEGLSDFNEGVRQTIFRYFQRFVTNLEEREYQEFFEITKLFSLYMSMFANQHFNQQLKELSMDYLAKLMAKYTDKRGKDYQDIKKFVSTTFVDFEFLNDKDVVNLFKTRRKRKKDDE